jgi:hypothetical protein
MGTTSSWTPERRVRQAEAIRRWQPWRNSTGPRTEEGKARSSRNADKGIAGFDALMNDAGIAVRNSCLAEAEKSLLQLEAVVGPVEH